MMSGLSECLLLFFPTHYLYDITTVTGCSVSSPPRIFLVVFVKTAVTADPHKTGGSRVADVPAERWKEGLLCGQLT